MFKPAQPATPLLLSVGWGREQIRLLKKMLPGKGYDSLCFDLAWGHSSSCGQRFRVRMLARILASLSHLKV